MHQIHAALLASGVRSKMYLANPHFAYPSVNMSFDELITAVYDMGPEDIVIAPELAEMSDGLVAEATKRGGAVVRWMLGLPRGFDSLDPRVLQIASTFYIRRQIRGCVGPVLTTPLEDEIYDRARNVNTQHTARRLVLVDGDTRLDMDDLRASLLPYGLDAKRFGNMTRNQTVDAFLAARAFVDGYLPGRERANFEAAIFGATPVVQRLLHGASLEDFPDDVPRLDDAGNIAEQLAAVEPFGGQSLVALAHAWRTDFPRRLQSTIDTRHLVIRIYRGGDRPSFWILPLVVSALCFAPLARLTFHDAAHPLDDDPYWRRALLGPAAYDALNTLGLLDRLDPSRAQGRPFELTLHPGVLFVAPFDLETTPIATELLPHGVAMLVAHDDQPSPPIVDNRHPIGLVDCAPKGCSHTDLVHLPAHPLWQSFFPLFDDELRRALGS